MNDQAAQLRQLVRRAPRDPNPAMQPRLVVVAGGKGGVGASTLTLNLAVVLSQHGHRGIAVDANMLRGDLAPMCHLPERYTIADVLSRRRDIHEILERGPAGIQIAPGIWAPTQNGLGGDAATERLLHQVSTLGRHAELVLVDVGTGAHPMASRFWHAADDVLLVTTPDSVAIMDSYATLKSISSQGTVSGRIWLVVNRSERTDESQQICNRFAESCRLFLGRGMDLFALVPHDERAGSSQNRDQPVVLSAPLCGASRAYERLVVELLAVEKREVRGRAA